MSRVAAGFNGQVVECYIVCLGVSPVNAPRTVVCVNDDPCVVGAAAVARATCAEGSAVLVCSRLRCTGGKQGGDGE